MRDLQQSVYKSYKMFLLFHTKTLRFIYIIFQPNEKYIYENGFYRIMSDQRLSFVI